jgi:hypothetical protein
MFLKHIYVHFEDMKRIQGGKKIHAAQVRLYVLEGLGGAGAWPLRLYRSNIYIYQIYLYIACVERATTLNTAPQPASLRTHPTLSCQTVSMTNPDMETNRGPILPRNRGPYHRPFPPRRYQTLTVRPTFPVCASESRRRHHRSSLHRRIEVHTQSRLTARTGHRGIAQRHIKPPSMIPHRG